MLSLLTISLIGTIVMPVYAADAYGEETTNLYSYNEGAMYDDDHVKEYSADVEDEKLQKDQNLAADAYDALQPYLTTSMAKGQLVNEAWAAKDYTRLDTIKPDGTYQVGEDGFMEFYPDADALQQAVLQLFYEKVE